MPAFFRAHAPLKRFDPARELEARIRMVAQVLVQIRMACHIPIQSGVPAQILVAVTGAGIVGTAIAFAAAGLTIEEGANVRIGPDELADFGFVVCQVRIVHDAWILAVTICEVRICLEEAIPLFAGWRIAIVVAGLLLRVITYLGIVAK